MKKVLAKAAIASLFVLIIVIVGGSIESGTFNITKWSKVTRQWCGYTFVAVSIASLMVISMESVTSTRDEKLEKEIIDKMLS